MLGVYCSISGHPHLRLLHVGNHRHRLLVFFLTLTMLDFYESQRNMVSVVYIYAEPRKQDKGVGRGPAKVNALFTCVYQSVAMPLRHS